MILCDISTLGQELKSYFLSNTDWQELTFNNSDKEKIKQLQGVVKVDSHSIKFQADENIIYVPSQYISLAIKIKTFAIELKKYTDVFDKLKKLNDKNILGEFINAKDILTNSDNLNKEDLGLIQKMFSTSNSDLNFGAKSILNGSSGNYTIRGISDFFSSVILKIINVPDASSAKLGSLIYSLTENLEIYNYLEIRFLNQLNYEFQILSKIQNTIYYGAPGTGKSYKVNEILKIINSNFYERITFHPEYDNSSFVGGYKPISDKDVIKYKFVPQAFTNIYVRAWNDLENQYYLAIEEINRGNCAEIFGDIFQLLDRNSNYTVSPSEELKNYLIEIFGDANHKGIVNGLNLPTNLSIVATMNTSDQSLFPMDSAFKRRWNWEYIPICYEEFIDEKKEKANESFNYIVKIDDSNSFKWIDFIKKVNLDKIKTNPNLGMDKCIGNYFIKSDSKEITLKEFINKVIFYLWNDVFKDEDNSESIFAKGISYEDFFPIETNGKTQLEKILKEINIEPTVIKNESSN